ncbi:hypothetical protein [Tunturiibacter gelidoferens]|uniref:Type IV secretory pathway TrbD component n=1 Tax=Tunturiibacter gelidiferens TaxID=3069689 RepID=A0ACC5P1W9_9BACT|nr:hypothetical protein [Edaphobacter lichenicola]MBB5340842.1 type IV secretory pathway TrbD component [Edaphobacter lichenicola]
MRREKKCGVVAGDGFAVLLVFLRGFWKKAGFGCGVLMVSLWWIAGGSVVFRRVFLGVERYASFSDLFLVLPDGPPARRAVTS